MACLPFLLRFRHSLSCLFIYLLLLLLNILVVLLEWFGHSSTHVLTVTVEACINLILVIEVVSTLWVQRWTYFHTWSNRLDLFLTSLCLCFFVLFLTHPTRRTNNNETDDEDDYFSVLDVIVLVIRYTFQLIRMSVIVYRSHRATGTIVQEEIDFAIPAMREKIALELAAIHPHHAYTKKERQALIRIHDNKVDGIEDFDEINLSHNGDHEAIDRLERAMEAGLSETREESKSKQVSSGKKMDHKLEKSNIHPSSSHSSLSIRSNSPHGRMTLLNARSTSDLTLDIGREHSKRGLDADDNR